MGTRSILISLTSVLLGAASIAAVSTFVVARQPGEASASAAPVRARPVSVTGLRSPNLDALVAEILQHPLFSPTRQPPDPAPAVEEAKADKEPLKPPGRLEGTAVLPGMREALFEREGDKPIAVKEGQTINGWTVTSIESDRVVLHSDDGEQIVKPANDAHAGPKPVLAANRKPPKPKRVAIGGPTAQPAPIPPQPQRLAQPIIPGR